MCSGSIWRNVTTYPRSPRKRTAYTRSPWPIPPTAPTFTSFAPSCRSTVTVLEIVDATPGCHGGASVVATRRSPLYCDSA